MSGTVEIFESKNLSDKPSRWVLYLEKKGRETAGCVIYSRNGPESRTASFPSLGQAQKYAETMGLASDPSLRLVRIFQMPAPEVRR